MLLASLAAPGCASHEQTIGVWEKMGLSAMKLEDARAWCRSEGVEKKGSAVRGDRYAADQLGAAFTRCMREKGWTWKTRVVSVDEAATWDGGGKGGSR